VEKQGLQTRPVRDWSLVKGRALANGGTNLNLVPCPIFDKGCGVKMRRCVQVVLVCVMQMTIFIIFVQARPPAGSNFLVVHDVKLNAACTNTDYKSVCSAGIKEWKPRLSSRPTSIATSKQLSNPPILTLPFSQALSRHEVHRHSRKRSCDHIRHLCLCNSDHRLRC